MRPKTRLKVISKPTHRHILKYYTGNVDNEWMNLKHTNTIHYISTEIVVMQFFIALRFFFSLPLSKYMNDIYFTIMIMWHLVLLLWYWLNDGAVRNGPSTTSVGTGHSQCGYHSLIWGFHFRRIIHRTKYNFNDVRKYSVGLIIWNNAIYGILPRHLCHIVNDKCD